VAVAASGVDDAPGCAVAAGATKVGVKDADGLQAARINTQRAANSKRKLENLCMALSLPPLFQDRSKINRSSQFVGIFGLFWLPGQRG
jgi:hypothetical protein